MSSIQYAINIIAFQITWFACVLGAVHGWPLVGIAAAIASVTLHLFLSENRPFELKLILLAMALGLLLEGALLFLGFTSFVGTQSADALPIPPAWLLAMWATFATLLNVSLSWLQPRLLLAVVFGFVGGPLAYLGGERLGGMTILEPRLLALVAIGVVWSIATAALVKAAAYGNNRTASSA